MQVSFALIFSLSQPELRLNQKTIHAFSIDMCIGTSAMIIWRMDKTEIMPMEATAGVSRRALLDVIIMHHRQKEKNGYGQICMSGLRICL
jgi:hypothetical protein